MRLTQEQVNAHLLRVHGATRAAPVVKAKRPKYGNRKVVDAVGNTHGSSHEYRNWCDLQLREKAGEISNLRRQVPYALVVNGILVCQYIADAVYVEGAATIVEDTKSAPTRKKPEYRIKVKLMAALHQLQVREIL